MTGGHLVEQDLRRGEPLTLNLGQMASDVEPDVGPDDAVVIVASEVLPPRISSTIGSNRTGLNTSLPKDEPGLRRGEHLKVVGVDMRPAGESRQRG